MKHVFTAIYDNRKNSELSLIFLSFSQREDDFLAVYRNMTVSNQINQEKYLKKIQNAST